MMQFEIGRLVRGRRMLLPTAVMLALLMPASALAIITNPPTRDIVVRADEYLDPGKTILSSTMQRYPAISRSVTCNVSGDFVVSGFGGGNLPVTVRWDDGTIIWSGTTIAAARKDPSGPVSLGRFKGSWVVPKQAFPGDHVITAETPGSSQVLRAVVVVAPPRTDGEIDELVKRLLPGDVLLTHKPAPSWSRAEAVQAIKNIALDIVRGKLGDTVGKLHPWALDQLGQYWTHSAILCNSGSVVEAGESGITSGSAKKWFQNVGADQECMVFRVPDSAADTKARAAACRSASDKVGKYSYDYAVVACAAVDNRLWGSISEANTLGEVLAAVKAMNGGEPVRQSIKNTNRFYCSKLVWWAYHDAGLDLKNIDMNKDYAVVYPEDLFAEKDSSIHFIRNSPVPASSKRAAFSATSLVVDVSGSMGDTWRDGVKIESAKSAADSLVSVIEGQSGQSGSGDSVSVCAFSTAADPLLGLSSDYSAVRNAINQLTPQSSTNIGDGIAVGLGQIQQSASNAERIMVLLSDGQNNTGMSNDEVLNGPVQDAADAGVVIYTIGFGDPGGIDEQFLREIAARTGGEYYPAEDALQLANTYIRIAVTTSMPNVLAELSGTVGQGQTAAAGSFEVSRTVGQIEAVLNWPGSVLDLRLKDPKGVMVSSGYPGLAVSTSARPQQMFIKNPAPGTWTVGVLGVEVSQPQEPYYVLVAGQDATSTGLATGAGGMVSDSSGALVALGGLCLLGLGAWAVASANRGDGSSDQAEAIASLGTTGSAGSATKTLMAGQPGWTGLELVDPAGRRYPLRSGPNAVGRASSNDVVIPDSSVSRSHASLVVAGSRMSVRDLGSSFGTYVNGVQTADSIVAAGDEIRLGKVRLVLSVAPPDLMDSLSDEGRGMLL